MTIVGFLASPRCPRCGGALCRDRDEDDPYCINCGYRIFERPEPVEPGKRVRQPVLRGQVRRVDRRLGSPS